MAADRLLYDALSPFFRCSQKWTLHFPMYVNTYCLAHHLAKGLKKRGVSSEKIDDHFVFDDWWRGHPTFTYRTDIEIFVAVNEGLEQLKRVGHDIQHKVLFTKYKQEHVFARRRCSSSLKPILITDVKPTALALSRKWQSSCPAWLRSYGVDRKTELDISPFWARSIGSLFERRRKIYVFGAPMTQIMLSQCDTRSQSYSCEPAQAAAIETFYAFRHNAGIADSEILELSSAISNYYDLVFHNQNTVIESGFELPRNYARLSLSSGQPNPFPEIYPGSPASRLRRRSAKAAELSDRYFGMLKRHHDYGSVQP